MREDIKKLFESKSFFIVTVVIAFIIIFSLVFKLGESVGLKRGSFRCDWGRNYERNFGMIRGGPLREGPVGLRENFVNPNGSVGKIIKVELPTIIVLDKDNLEKNILINKDTVIRKMRENLTQDNLKINDFVVVIGTPNDQGQIEAKLIRVMPVNNLNRPQ